MLVKDVMTPNVEYMKSGTTVADAARKMREFDCGFLPVADETGEKLQGVVTDRDIVLRGVSEGVDLDKTAVDTICGDRVLYCYQSDDLDVAAKSMRDQQIWRLIVLDNPEDKNLAGILSAGDIVRHGQEDVATGIAKDVNRAA